jgi:phosphodiesterase/alkaline phosphatase D-like protein
VNRFVQRVCLLGVAVLLLSACTFGAPATLPQTATATAPPPSAATLQEAEDAPALPATLPNGIAAGDVDQTSVVLWARSTATGPITFTLSLAEGEGIEPQTRASRVLDPSIPLTVSVTGLTPGSPYVYRVSDSAGGQMTGRFRTAADDKRTGLRFGASGDWRGDLAPYPAMTNIPESDLDFFVALGDTIYADIGSPAVPPQVRRGLRLPRQLESLGPGTGEYGALCHHRRPRSLE